MIYLKVAHIEDNDCDIFSFSDLQRAITYIIENKIEDYILSDIPFEEFSLNDYTRQMDLSDYLVD